MYINPSQNDIFTQNSSYGITANSGGAPSSPADLLRMHMVQGGAVPRAAESVNLASLMNSSQAAGSSLPASLSPATAFAQSIQRIELALTQLGTIASSMAAFKGDDSALSIGGALNFARQVGNYYDFFSARPQADAFGQAAGKVGALGQNMLMQGLQTDLAGALAKVAGIDSSGLSIDGLGKSVVGILRGNSAAEGLTSGTNSLAAQGAAESSAGNAAGMTSSAGRVLGAAGAAYSAYGLIKNWGHSSPGAGAMQGACVGAYIGSVVPGLGTLVGGLIGGAVGGLIGCIKTGKHKDQVARDRMRDALQGCGFLDKQWQFKLADGSAYDMGKDGGFKLTNLDGTTRRAYEIDWQNPLAGTVVGMLNPLGQALFPDNEKLRTDLIGYLTNGALSNATDVESARANVAAIVQQLRRG